MRQATFVDLARKLFAQGWQVEEAYDQMETLLSASDRAQEEARVASIRLKSSPRFYEALNRYVALLESGAELPFADVAHRGRVLATRRDLIELFASTYSYLPVAKRFDKVRRRILYLLEPLEAERAKALEQELSRSERHVHTPPKQVRRLARAKAREEFRPIREKADAWGHFDLFRLYVRLFADDALAAQALGALPPMWKQIGRLTRAAIGNRRIPQEDVAPLFFLAAALGSVEPSPEIRHTVIDEAQDYTYFHFAGLAKLFPRSTFTVLGDWNQAIHPVAEAPDPSILPHLMNGEPAREIKLGKSYRSTREIAEFAKSILGPDAAAFESVERRGEKPVLIEAADDQQLLAAIERELLALQSEGYESIAVIARTQNQSQALWEALRARRIDVPLRLVTKDDRRFEKGTVVIPSYLAKGLEFDAVVLHDVGERSYNKPTERELLYTACTRALHKLVVGFVAPRSPLLANATPDLFTLKRATQGEGGPVEK